MPNNVSIATKPLVYSAFRYINNKVWNALAEYIDNSIQSFLDHRTVLSKINHDGKLNISLNIDIDNDVITIEDDAFGIEEHNYQRAFELANIPLDAKGLNEFGMGMKVSSIWLSDIWTVETSAYGDAVKKTLTFDIKEVVDNQETELPVKEEIINKEDHFTKITLTKLSLNKPSMRQLSYIKKHLASIYIKYIRENVVNLVVNDEKLEFKELPILKAPYYKTPKGEEIVWRKNITFSAPKPNGEGYYIANGFIGVLETMSTSTDNGFLLFRRGRVIGSSYDDRYRPTELCGQVGSPRYKRIFGELDLDGFDVSFTKNSFQEDGDFEAFIDLLKDEILHDSSLDLFGQAQNYVKPKSQKEKKDLGKTLISKVAQELSKPIEVPSDVATESETLTNEEHPVKEYEVDTSNNLIVEESPNENKIEPITTTVKLQNGEEIELTIKCEQGNSDTIFYTLIKEADSKYTSTINLRNPFFDMYSESLSTANGLEQIAYVIKIMVTTELLLGISGKAISGSEFRNVFNKLFGKQ